MALFDKKKLKDVPEEVVGDDAGKPEAEKVPVPVLISFTRDEVQSIFNSAEALMDSVFNHPDQKGRVTSIMSITKSKLV